jgi:DNA-binding NarL/FixJ family response regulator
VRATNPKRRPKVCLISSHPLVLQGFQQTLGEKAFDVRAVLLETTLASGLRTHPLPRVPLYVCDANLPGPALEALLAGIVLRFPDARIIVAAEHFSKQFSFALLRLGVKGLLAYKDTQEQFARAILMVAGGGFWVPRTILSGFLESILQSKQGQRLRLSGTRDLSPREQQTLDFLLENLANKEIAGKMNISERTVKFHVSNLLAKYSVQRRADLILLCYQRQNPGV